MRTTALKYDDYGNVSDDEPKNAEAKRIASGTTQSSIRQGV
jgi:hypothetical protein